MKTTASLLCLTSLALSAGLSKAGETPAYEVLKYFGEVSQGAYPAAGLILGNDGAFYGAFPYGGRFDNGTIAKINADGTSLTTLKELEVAVTGGYSHGGLIQGQDGALYGTTSTGGTSDGGTIFKINVDGTGFTVLKHLETATTGSRPMASLIQGHDGTLYGTNSGAEDTSGNVFKLNPDGTGFTVLHTFNGPTDGLSPESSVCLGDDGYLYGTTHRGGSDNSGTVFKLSTDGAEFTVIKDLDEISGFASYEGLVKVPGGTMYGATSRGGANSSGTLFKVTPNGAEFIVVENLAIGATGASPTAPLVLGTDGWIHGIMSIGGSTHVPGDGSGGKDDGSGAGYGTQFKFKADGTEFTVTRHFTSRQTIVGLTQGSDDLFYVLSSNEGTFESGSFSRLDDEVTVLRSFFYGVDTSSGGSPSAAMVQGAEGSLYGTTMLGGKDAGTVFKVETDGSGSTVLKRFIPAADGRFLYTGLTPGANGVFYGTGQYGGLTDDGTIFKINADGTDFTVIKHFESSVTGRHPSFGRLLLGADGALYGSTTNGGETDDGTLFKVNADGTGFTVLKHLVREITGDNPSNSFVQGSDGTLYGTTQEGGSFGDGTLFKLNPDGTNFSVLKHLESQVTGRTPLGILILGNDGKIYGTTQQGGSQNWGTIFSLKTDGSQFTVVKPLDSSTGGIMFSGLLQASDGKLYGSAYRGGVNDGGTIFRLQTDGTDFEVLHHFDEKNGSSPMGGLMLARDGYLYGTTSGGGYGSSAGVLFRLRADILPAPSIVVEQPVGSRLYPGNSRELEALSLGESALMTFSIRNDGLADLSDVRAQISGLQAGDFYLESAPQSTVASAESTTFKIRFTPQALGERNSTLRIYSNDSRHSPFVVNLSGTATTADRVNPTLNVTAPARNAVIKPSAFTVKGTVSDGKGITGVTVALNGGEDIPATLQLGGGVNPRQSLRSPPRSVGGQPGFSLDINLAPGKNVIVVKATNGDGKVTTVIRTFFHDTRRPLTITRSIPKGQDRHDKICVVSLAADPVQAASALQPNEQPFSSTSNVVIGANVTLTATATASSGYVFRQWNDLPEGATFTGNTANFIMPSEAASEVRAEFMHSPFYARGGGSNTFSGLIYPTDGAPSSNVTHGFITGTLNTLTGAFSGTILIDGLSQPITATFFGDGSCLFSMGSAKLPALSFGNKTLTMSYDQWGDTIIATVTQSAGTSQGFANRGSYSSTHTVPENLLDAASKKGSYTLAIGPPDSDASIYPKGFGYATLSISNQGIVTLTGLLADGTSITASSFLVRGNECPIFVQYGTPGSTNKTMGSSFSGMLSFDRDRPYTDVTGTSMFWVRAAAQGNVPLYTEGWPTGARVEAFGTFCVKPFNVQTALNLVQPDISSPRGNASLGFSDGKLASPVVKTNFNIKANAVTKIAPADASYTLTFKSTGVFTGTFNALFGSNTTMVKSTYQGVIIHKGEHREGYGFFIGNTKDEPDPESGRVVLYSPNR